METEVSPEMASQVLGMLTGGGSMDHINTSLALRLIPLAQEVGRFGPRGKVASNTPARWPRTMKNVDGPNLRR